MRYAAAGALAWLAGCRERDEGEVPIEKRWLVENQSHDFLHPARARPPSPVTSQAMSHIMTARPNGDDELRAHLVRLLTWEDAHVSYEAAVRDLAPDLRGGVPPGTPHSAWQLVEHLRLTQRDILDFSQADAYAELEWPAGYWPSTPEPPTHASWDESVTGYLADRATLVELARNPSTDLLAPVPNGTGQTYLRELLLVADHSAYHVGQLVLVRRLLGAWPPE